MTRENTKEEIAVARQAIKNTPHMEMKADYSKSVRNRIDNPSKRNRIKEDTFAGKKTIKDPYTGETLHKDTAAAKAKYGKGKYTNHTAQVDHTVPLEQVHNRTKDNPFLDYKDVKEIANQEKNLKVINSHTNQSKQSQSNIKHIKKNADSISKEQQKKMITEQVKAEVAVNKEIAGRTIKNANEIGMDAAKAGAKFGFGVSVARNATKVINGEVDLDEAIVKVGMETAKAGAVSYGTAVGTRIVEGVANSAARSTCTQLANGATKFISNGGPAKAVVVVMEAGDSIVKYIKGEITAVECIYELGEKGTSLAVSFEAGCGGAVLGGGVGGFIGGIVGSVLPGAGTVAGAALGAKVGAITGEIVGNIVGYMIGSELYRRVGEFLASHTVPAEDYKKLEAMYNELAKDMAKSREELEKSLKSIHFEHRMTIWNGFEMMKEAIIQNDIAQINMSLQQICNEFGVSVAFQTREEFNRFMLDPDTVIRIGKS